MSKGWIKLHRTLADWQWYDDHKAVRLLIHLQITVNYEDKRWHGDLINAGSRVFSWDKLSSEIGMSKQQLRTAMSKLEKSKEVTRISTGNYQVVSLIKWGQMQSNQQEVNTEDNTLVTPLQHPDNTLVTPTKEKKKVRSKESKKEEIVLLCSLSKETELDFYENIAFAFFKLFRENLISSGITETTTLNKARLDTWSKTIRLMHERDNRPKEEFQIVWQFLRHNEFWKRNVQSVSALRKQFERLYIQAKSSGIGGATKGGYDNILKSIYDKYSS